jgi:hypothetical protein
LNLRKIISFFSPSFSTIVCSAYWTNFNRVRSNDFKPGTHWHMFVFIDPMRYLSTVRFIFIRMWTYSLFL